MHFVCVSHGVNLPPSDLSPLMRQKRTCRTLRPTSAADPFETSAIALRVILDAAVERIGGANLPRSRPNHQLITLRGVEIDRTIQGEAVEDERQAASGDRVGLVEKTEMQMRAFRGAGVP